VVSVSHIACADSRRLSTFSAGVPRSIKYLVDVKLVPEHGYAFTHHATLQVSSASHCFVSNVSTKLG